ncbi:hypothetical protein COCVIDRAFT_38285 [Bipolaris victoriae FI3]|uniref:Uncharacterized protein n=1 Tax=Bipolaris victoriae (strain FI3) TaxID=930091 RepID=W7EKL9_BIPV3|nr:hypothetical protein COCVIDRAFT_38285 [Bipolaris victoriae FI3]
MSAPDDTNLKALLLLSKESLLARARESLLRSLPNNKLAKLVAQIISRDKPRGDLEEIARMMLDVLARRDAQNDALHGLATKNDTAVTTGTQTADKTGLVSKVSKETTKDKSPLPTRKRPASERSPSTIEETANTKRAKNEDESTAPSLRTWNHEQIAGKPVQVTAVLYWNPVKECYSKLALDKAGNPLANLLTYEFDTEYLSESDHIDTWKDINTTACGNCIHHEQICARLVNFRGSIKLVFFPLPPRLRCVDELQEPRLWILSARYD